MAKSEMKYYDYGDDSLTAEEVILKVERVVDSICNTLSDSDGDMWMSQYRELMGCGWRLHYIKKQIEETD
jgi:hypothetical protein